MSDVIWCYAEEDDSELWRGHCATREAAIAEGTAETQFDGFTSFYIAPFTPATAEQYMPKAKDILESAHGQAWDDGECDPFEASAEAMAELDAYLSSWAARHVAAPRILLPAGPVELVER